MHASSTSLGSSSRTRAFAALSLQTIRRHCSHWDSNRGLATSSPLRPAPDGLPLADTEMLCVCALQLYLLLEVGVARTHLGSTLNGSKRLQRGARLTASCATPIATRPSPGHRQGCWPRGSSAWLCGYVVVWAGEDRCGHGVGKPAVVKASIPGVFIVKVPAACYGGGPGRVDTRLQEHLLVSV